MFPDVPKCSPAPLAMPAGFARFRPSSPKLQFETNQPILNYQYEENKLNLFYVTIEMCVNGNTGCLKKVD